VTIDNRYIVSGSGDKTIAAVLWGEIANKKHIIYFDDWIYPIISD
jgi:hypothetical protein